MSRYNISNASTVNISADYSSFAKSQRGEEMFYAPVGLYQVLLCI